MGARALEFRRAHPDESPGYNAALADLQAQLNQSRQLATQQREGILEVRAASARKKELRRSIRQNHLLHLSRVAQRAAKDLPELAQKFTLGRDPLSYLAFNTLANSMMTEAQRQKELLIKHGLMEQVLDSLVPSLEQFDLAVEQGAQGRRVHIGASADLDVVADEVVQIVKIVDGLNRFRFAHDADLLAAWKAASNVIGPPRPTEKPTSPNLPSTGDDVRPAA
jgi:hypothetical protein